MFSRGFGDPDDFISESTGFALAEARKKNPAGM